MSLSLAIAQIQLRPQYHESYSVKKPVKAGRKVSPLHISRKNKLYEISLKLGKAQNAEIFAVMRETDKTINLDDCRKTLNELCEDGLMIRTETVIKRKVVFYTAVEQ